MVARVVKSAVGLNVHESDVEPPRNYKECVDLIGNRTLESGERDIEGSSSKTCTVRIAGMSAGCDMILLRESQSLLHCGRITGVAAACDIGGRDVAHQFGITAIRQTLRRFSEICVEVDGQIGHMNSLFALSRQRFVVIRKMPRITRAPGRARVP